MRLSPGSRLGNYEVVGVLGAGGMGEVYEARDLRLGRTVALKVVGSDSLDPTSVRRLEEEARAASVLNHQNIVTIYGVGEEGHNTFIAMEFVLGTSLRTLLAGGALPIAQTFDIAVQLAEAMAAAHDAGIVHRDLKPDNVILTRDGIAKVLDFGLARRRIAADEPTAGVDTSAPLTKEGMILGTVGYMSPEQASGRPLGPQSDQFSFGIILYEMLAGLRPFRRATAVETMAAIINASPDPIHTLNACVPEPIERLVDRLLAKSPKDRFASTRDLAAQLRTMRSQSNDAYYDQPVAPAETVLLAPVISRRRAIWLGGAAAAAAIAGGGTWALWPAASTRRSLAVLPFSNGSSDPDAEYLSEGITESLIQRVSQIPSITVKARSTVFGFKGKTVDPIAAGKQLNVDAILTGSISERQGRVLVAAELVDVASGTRLWGQTYDREASALLGLQDEIAAAIVNDGLHVRPSPVESQRLSRKPTNDPQAYELYMRARHQFLFETEESYLSCRELAQRAITRDPRFALAYVLLGSTYSVMAIDGFARPTESWPVASRNFTSALEIDPAITDARFGEADQKFFFDWDFDGAERVWQGIVDDPRGVVDPDWYRARALRFWALGQTDRALEAIRLARQLDPVGVGLRVTECDYLLKSGKLDQAIAKYEEVIREVPADPRAHFGLSEALFLQRRFDDAIDARREAEKALGDPSLDEVLVAASGEVGFKSIEREAAKLQITDMTARVKTGGYVSPLDFARAFSLLGEVEQAFSYFEPAFADRAPALVFLNVDRSWDAIRRDSRFVSAVKRVGLPVVSSPL